MIFQTTSLQTDESRSQEAPWRLNSKWGEWTHLWSCFSKYRRCYVYSVFKLRQCYSYYEVCQPKQRNGFIFEITERQFAKHGEIWRDSDTRRYQSYPYNELTAISILCRAPSRMLRGQAIFILWKPEPPGSEEEAVIKTHSGLLPYLFEETEEIPTHYLLHILLAIASF